MKPLLIVFSSQTGQTQKIVNFISAELSKRNIICDLFTARDLPKKISLNHFSGAIIASPIRFDRPDRKVLDFANAHAKELRHVPVAIFTVCFSILSEIRQTAISTEINRLSLEKAIGREPELSQSFAGAVKQSEYNWLTRQVIKRMKTKRKYPVELSKNIEYTDWEEVKRFTDSFANILRSGSSS